MDALHRRIPDALPGHAGRRRGRWPDGWGHVARRTRTRQVKRIPLPERARVWRLILDRGVSEEALQESRRRVTAAIAEFEHALGENPYLAGPTYSLADLDAMTTLHSWPLMRPEINETEHAQPLGLVSTAARAGRDQGSFTLGRFIGPRMGEVRQKLGLED